MSDKPAKPVEATTGRDFWSDPRVIEAATLAVPLALDFAGKKLAEAYARFKTRFEAETDQDFDTVEPTAAQQEAAQAFIDRVPAETENFSDDLRERLVSGGAKVSCIIADDTITWQGKGLDALQIHHARQKLGMLTVDLSGANLHDADLSGTSDLLTNADFSKLPKPF